MFYLLYEINIYIYFINIYLIKNLLNPIYDYILLVPYYALDLNRIHLPNYTYQIIFCYASVTLMDEGKD